MKLSEFEYTLPDDLIAQQPIEPRDAARLLDARDLSDHHMRDLPTMLEAGDIVVVNTTKVRAARLIGTRHITGGRVEMLVLRPTGDHWEVLLRPARRLREGVTIDFQGLTATLVTDPDDGLALAELEAPAGDVEQAIAASGEMPLPPYITQGLSDPDRYQTVFAERVGSAAAPTAGLHFTEQLLGELRTAGIEIATIDLQVGLDTFRPIASDDVEHHEMHSEVLAVSDEAVQSISDARRRGGRVVAVGTTVVRALETATASGQLRPTDGSTDLYITPGYRFRAVDMLVTNFHLPRSSLLVMLAAFAGPTWRIAYEAAIERRYRFLSLGDATLFARQVGAADA